MTSEMRVSRITYGPYKGVVEKVHDGDTIYVALDLGFDLTVHTRVRVFGINAPELSTEAGKLSRDYAAHLLPVGSAVTVVSYGWDKYGGRIDGSILSPDGDFATHMVEDGHAVWLA